MGQDAVSPDRREGRDRRDAQPFHLTAREAEILAFVLRGRSNKDIATELGLAEQSIKGHVSALLQKFAVPNRAALAEAGGRLALTGGIALDPQWIPQLFRDAEPQICVARGPEFRIEAVNEAFVQAVGNRPLLGRTAREAFPELEGQGVIEVNERVYATGEAVIRHEASSSWDRGRGVEARLIDIVVQPLRDEAGAVNGIVSFAVDVTDQVRQRRRAALTSDGLEAVLDLVPRGVIIVDDEGTIVAANKTAHRMAGISDTPPPLDIQPDGLIGRALRGENVLGADYVLVTGPAERSVRVRASFRPLRSALGDVRGAIIEFTPLR